MSAHIEYLSSKEVYMEYGDVSIHAEWDFDDWVILQVIEDEEDVTEDTRMNDWAYETLKEELRKADQEFYYVYADEEYYDGFSRFPTKRFSC